MPLPRVTDILRKAGLIPTGGYPEAMERGRAVHEAIEARHYEFDDVEIPPELSGYLDAYESFLADSGHIPVVSELEIVHPTLYYVGHVDRLGRRKNSDDLDLIDWKTGTTCDETLGACQVAAYGLAWSAAHRAPLPRLMLVNLQPSGHYRVHLIDKTKRERAERLFLAALELIRGR